MSNYDDDGDLMNNGNIFDNPEYIKAKQYQRRIRRGESSDTVKGFSPDMKAILGLCASCAYHEYAINDLHQIVVSRCEMFESSLGRHSIKECSNYKSRGSLPLSMLFGMAKLIDIDKKKKTGFLEKIKK